MENKWDEIKPKYADVPKEYKTLPVYYDFYTAKDFQNVYEPAEDTFLLIDALRIDEETQDKTFDSSVELGCGNGLVSCCFISSGRGKTHYCADINKAALDLTRRLLQFYNLDTNTLFVESNLFNGFDQTQVFDLIIFNPPYVTTDKDELILAQENKDISASWAGGLNGSEVIFKFIEQLKTHITSKTKVFLLLSEENEWEKIITQMKEELHFHCEVKIVIKYVSAYLNAKLGMKN